jgi:hypothetical protein
MERWYGKRPLLLENHDLDLAVSVGAAYYAYVRSTGAGLLVRGGLPRAYYLGIQSDGETLGTLCLAPRGTEEGATLEIDRDDLQLVANKPVSFRLYSSLSRTEDKLGDAVEFPVSDLESNLHTHAPLNAVIRFGRKAEERMIPVKLGARLTEVGTLEIWADSKISEHRWRLQFELRKAAKTAEPTKPAAVISEDSLNKAHELLKSTFGPNPSIAPEELPNKLEQALALGKNSWPLSTIRQMADWFLELAEGRGRGPSYESRWLNLAGWCLRPGFGFPGDDFRIEQARRVYASGMRFPNQIQCEIDWWIFCGRLAGGLNRNQQSDIFQRLSPTLLPRGQKKQRVNTSLLREMWRTASSLELLPMQTKTDLGDALVKRLKAGEGSPSEIWCLSRIGARQLFYGPNNQVVPPATAARWVDALLKLPKTEEALASIAQHTGDATRDLPATVLNAVRAKLQNNPELLAVVEGQETRDLRTMGRMFGEELPGGLVFAGQPEVVHD